MNDTTKRRTKRRYAHELYPHPGEDIADIRPLAVEVPRLYALALGHEVWGTGWFEAIRDEERRREAADRTVDLIQHRELAFLADAIAQGLTGDEAWRWAQAHLADESGELAWERAEHYGVRPQAIKPYPCGPALQRHRHYANQEDQSGVTTLVDGPEDACPVCTEPIPAEEATP